MEIIETVLENIYSASDQYRILNDPEYFIDLLVKQYRPEFKYDCKLLEKGIRCGAGNIVWQFAHRRGQREIYFPPARESKSYLG